MASRSRLRQFIIEYFSDDELEDLTFDYFPDVSRLYTSRMTKGQKARELIEFVDRRGRMEHLTAALEKARPEAYCEYFNTEFEAPPAPVISKRNPQQVFLSHANPDADFAYQLAADLRTANFEVWMAPDSIQPGEKWVDAINRGLMESGIFLLVLTPDAVSSKWVYDETSVAIALENKNQMRFFSLSVRAAEAPPLWSIRQHIDFEQDYDRGFKALLAALRPSLQGKTAMLRPLAAQPPEEQAIGAPAMIRGDRPHLVIDWPEAPQQTFTLESALTRVGRAPLNDLILNFAAVSSSHLLLQTEGTPDKYKITVMDLGSTNGTYLNGRKLPPNSAHPLEPGDKLYLGDPAGLSLPLTLTLPATAIAAATVDKAATRPISTYETQSAAAAPAGTGRKSPKWLPMAGVLVLLGIAIGAYTVFANKGPEGKVSDQGVATIGVELPTSFATEALAAVIPTNTTEPTSTIEPTEPKATPSTEPTRTSPPTATVEPTDGPTATLAPSSTPPPVAANTIRLGPGTALDFEEFGVWARGDQENGTLTQSTEETRSGTKAAKLDYDFPSAANDFVVFLQEHAIDGTPNALRLWVYGNGSGHFFNAWIIDAEGQTWQTPFGQILHQGWQQMTALIDPDQGWPWTHISGTDDGEVDYPIRLRGLVLDDRAADFIGKGTIYLDDLSVATVEEAENVAAGSSSSTVEPDETTVPGAIGSIFFTSGDSLYTTDPTWPAAQLVGPASTNTCSSTAKTESSSFALDPAPYCNIGGGTAVCASPDGRFEVLVGTTPAGRSILVRPASTEGGNFIYDGPLDQSEGILWSPTSGSFLFVIGDDVNQGFPEGGSRVIIESALSPQFAPDGQSILFVRIGGSREVIVWRDGAAEQNVSNLGLSDAFCPRWAAGS